MQSQILVQSQILDMYRAGLRSAADMMSATVETTRRLQQQQLEALHTAMADQARTVRELSEVSSMDQLMALQMRLASTQLERTIEMWGGMWRAAGNNPFGQQLRDVGISTSTSIATALREAAQNEHDERKSA